MNETNRRKQVNPIRVAPLLRWVFVALFMACVGLGYLYVKQCQHALGEETRRIERQISELRSRNEVLLSQITSLSSRSSLQRRLDDGFIAMMPIQDHLIARLTPPTTAESDGVLRTAANDRRRQ